MLESRDNYMQEELVNIYKEKNQSGFCVFLILKGRINFLCWKKIDGGKEESKYY